ncbi:aminotransferase class V-fold PLP-dependent enzyme [Candidatus Bipolaricaulota bacterium]|nr:aminotransferase class V-fold PLP-dependent enzyme [Candidatus Bipolaricaulota bacterium]
MDLQAIRREFPTLEKVVWLASAGVGPLTCRALAAWEKAQRSLYQEFDPEAWREAGRIQERVRGLGATLLGVDPEEVALTRSTTEGLNAVATAIPWRRGDNVVITDQEYPANAIPWYHQARLHGLQVRVVRSRNGRLPVEAFAAAVDGRTRVVAISHVQFGSGFRADLAGLAELAHAHGALFVVDAIQSVGAVRVLPRELGVDALACGGYKWLCGPEGTGLLYVRHKLAEGLHPRAVGFPNISQAEQEDLWEALCGGRGWVRDFAGYAQGAIRFEGVGFNPALLSAFAAGLEYFLELGLGWIEERVLELSGQLIAELTRLGLEVVTPGDPRERAGIVLVRGPWDLRDPSTHKSVEAHFLSRGIRIHVRAGGIRISTHFFNSEDDLDLFVEALAEWQKGKGP